MIDTCISLKTVPTISPTTPSCLSSLGTQEVTNLHYRITDNCVAEIQQHLVKLCLRAWQKILSKRINIIIIGVFEFNNNKSSPCITIIPTIRPTTRSCSSSLGSQGEENIRTSDRLQTKFYDAIFCVKLYESIAVLFDQTKGSLS